MFVIRGLFFYELDYGELDLGLLIAGHPWGLFACWGPCGQLRGRNYSDCLGTSTFLAFLGLCLRETRARS